MLVHPRAEPITCGREPPRLHAALFRRQARPPSPAGPCLRAAGLRAGRRPRAGRLHDGASGLQGSGAVLGRRHASPPGSADVAPILILARQACTPILLTDQLRARPWRPADPGVGPADGAGRTDGRPTSAADAGRRRARPLRVARVGLASDPTVTLRRRRRCGKRPLADGARGRRPPAPRGRARVLHAVHGRPGPRPREPEGHVRLRRATRRPGTSSPSSTRPRRSTSGRRGTSRRDPALEARQARAPRRREARRRRRRGRGRPPRLDRRGGLDDDILPLLDDALEGHAELSDLHAGARLRHRSRPRSASTARSSRYAALDAVEYTPGAAGAKPLRVYYFRQDADDDVARPLGQAARQRQGAERFYDAKGQQPIARRLAHRRCRSRASRRASTRSGCTRSST